MIRLSKAVVVACIAFFFACIAFNNLADFSTNDWLVKKVLSMEDVANADVKWRAIHAPELMRAAYILIIVIEILVAILCFISATLMLRPKSHNKGRSVGLFGLSLAFVLFVVGFLAVGNECFYMWQIPSLANLPLKASVYGVLTLCSMIFIASKAPE